METFTRRGSFAFQLLITSGPNLFPVLGGMLPHCASTAAVHVFTYTAVQRISGGGCLFIHLFLRFGETALLCFNWEDWDYLVNGNYL